MAQRGWKLRQFAGVAERPCYYCDESVTVFTATVDHLIPRSKGGASVDPNLVLSCKPCNGWKGNRTVAEFVRFVRDIASGPSARWLKRNGELALMHLKRVWARHEHWSQRSGLRAEKVGTLAQPRARRAKPKVSDDDRLAHKNASQPMTMRDWPTGRW